ncbi:hypothetical protein [Flavobacterium cellulosilyticum]|uniref:Uncharacterized protein n=1 Tax=Flavobacterium cellulosilyticum TaxID=2541731 RepID=A0A4R5CBD5_9FLAO|nr:hypothetical protein [Flavobacterium cellulosilyticum]TDD94392.1 hypothetical protein E0F76_16460 [Flavobacterium cellulosilyticum]
MEVQYQGKQKGKSTKFTIKIINNNISRTSSNYQVALYVGDNKLPLFKSAIHKSLSNCLKEIYLFRKHNHIDFVTSSEKVVPKLAPYDLVLYNYNKKVLFMA